MSLRRQSIAIPGFSHGQQPIPAACRRGPLLMTGGVHGMDRATGQLAPTLDEQVEHMFGNLAAILEAAGGSMDDIVKVTVYATTHETRDAVNRCWLEAFPHPASRPARHTRINQALRPPILVQCDAVAFIDGPAA